MKKKIILCAIALVALIAATICFIYFGNNKKPTDHHIFAEDFVNLFVTDNPTEQFKLLDVYKINSDKTALDNLEYKRSPLVKKDHSVVITNTREANENVLKKINNVYKNYCKSSGITEIFTAQKAYRYNVKIKNRGKQIYNVSFWIVQSDDELYICTLYEYERSLDRGFMANLY